MAAAAREGADLRHDVSAGEFLGEGPDRAAFEVKPEHGADRLGLLGYDDQLLVHGGVAERDRAADPQPLALGGRDLVADPLADDLPLELGKRQQHVEGQPTHAGGGIEGLRDRHERDGMLVEQLHQLGEIGQRAGQAVDLVDDDDVDLAVADIVQQPLQRRPVQGGAGQAAIVIPGPDQPPALVGLTLDIGLAGLPLGIEGVEFQVEIMLGGFARVDGAAEKLSWRVRHHRPASPRSAFRFIRRPKKRRPFHDVPVMARATAERLG